jgi:hypothetical protein
MNISADMQCLLQDKNWILTLNFASHCKTNVKKVKVPRNRPEGPEGGG